MPFLHHPLRLSFPPRRAGPWGHNRCTARFIIGLCVVIAQRHALMKFVPAAIDRGHFPPAELLAPIEVTNRSSRWPGASSGRSRILSGGTSNGRRASCQLLRTTESAMPGLVAVPNWDVPAPRGHSRAHRSSSWPELQMDETRPPSHRRAMGTIGPAAAVDERGAHLVREGAPLTPIRAGRVGADFASPFANAVDHGWGGCGGGGVGGGPRLHQQRTSPCTLHRLPEQNGFGFGG